MIEPLTDEEIMAKVWIAPDCPVKLTSPDVEYPWGPEIEWPRERVELPRDARPVWHHQCSCRNAPVRAIADLDDLPMAIRVPIVEMTGRRFAVLRGDNDPPTVVNVYLGQCPDCGRIYWSLARWF